MSKEIQHPSDEQISVRAYYLWERDGRPDSRDWEYWLRAKEELVCEASRAAKPITSGEPKAGSKKKSSRIPTLV